jgi:hypothetical protein
MATHQLHRVGAVCSIAGTVIAGISNSMHPPLTDPAGILGNAAGTTNWVTIHWGLIIGIVVMQLGFYAVIDTLRVPTDQTDKDQYGSWAHYMLTVGLVLWISVFAAEIGLKPLADAVNDDQSNRAGALALASLADTTATAAICVYFLGITLLGLAIWMTGHHPRWIGIMGIAVGAVLTLSVGVRKAFLGASTWTEGLPFQTLVVLFWIWTVVVATRLWHNSVRIGDAVWDFPHRS